MIPYLHQKNLLDLNPDKWGLWWATGAAKSLPSLWLANRKNLPTLIVAKKDLTAKWERDAKDTLTVPYEVISKENLKKRWAELPRYGTVIIDEAHNVFGQFTRKKEDEDGKTTKNLTISGSANAYIRKHEPQCVYLLTATPYTSTPWNVYRAAKLLGRDWKYKDFQNAFFTKRYVWYGRGDRMIWQPIKDAVAKKNLQTVLRKLGNVVHLEDCVDVPEQVVKVVRLSETAEQERLKKDLYASEPSARHMIHSRIEAGHVSGEGYEENQYLTCPVIEAVKQYAVEFPKLIVVCRFRLQMEHLKHVLRGYNVLELHGDVKDRDSIVQRAEGLSEVILLVQAACSEGYELPSFRTMVFAGLDNALKSWIQMKGRILRINHLKKNLYIVLLGGKATSAVWKSVSGQMDFSPVNYE